MAKRIEALQDYICRETGVAWPSIQLSGELTTDSFIEGFMTALAFCCGAVSGGKARDFLSFRVGHIEIPGLVNFASAAMDRQTLWPQNEERFDEPA